jgi:hypothetical protein
MLTVSVGGKSFHFFSFFTGRMSPYVGEFDGMVFVVLLTMLKITISRITTGILAITIRRFSIS